MNPLLQEATVIFSEGLQKHALKSKLSSENGFNKIAHGYDS